jgi:hypothetical protein
MAISNLETHLTAMAPINGVSLGKQADAAVADRLSSNTMTFN